MIDGTRDERFRALQHSYLADLDEELSRLRDAIGASGHAERESISAATRAEVLRHAHNWKGSGGAYGFPEISNAAGRLESLLRGTSSDDELRTAFEVVLSVHRSLCHDRGKR